MIIIMIDDILLMFNTMVTIMKFAMTNGHWPSLYLHHPHHHHNIIFAVNLWCQRNPTHRDALGLSGDSYDDAHDHYNDDDIDGVGDDDHDT